jgi:hypothetical protein
MRYSLRRALSLDSVNGGTHNPKVVGSNPTLATNAIIGLQAKLLFPAAARRRIQGCFGGLFHFASWFPLMTDMFPNGLKALRTIGGGWL